MTACKLWTLPWLVSDLGLGHGFLARLAAFELGPAAGFLAELAENVGNLALDRGRGDVVLEIIGFLFLAAALGLFHGALHGAGDFVGIENDAGIRIAGGAANGLDQRGL